MNSVSVNSPLVFVSGKGGVGKTTWAYCLAQKMAQSGKKVLLVEFGERSFFELLLGRPVGMTPTQLESGLEVSCWSGETCLQDYVGHFIRVESLSKLFFQNKVMRSLLRGAPALKELALLGKATSGPRHHGPALNYDHIVFDSYSTGHFLALLRAPRGMHEAVKRGPMGQQSLSIVQTLKDPKLCQFHLVTLLEDLPVSEMLELQEALQKEFNSNIEIIVNKKLPHPPIEEEASLLAEGAARSIGAEAAVALFRAHHQQTIQRQSDALALLPQSSWVTLPWVFEVEWADMVQKLSATFEVRLGA